TRDQRDAVRDNETQGPRNPAYAAEEQRDAASEHPETEGDRQQILDPEEDRRPIVESVPEKPLPRGRHHDGGERDGRPDQSAGREDRPWRRRVASPWALGIRGGFSAHRRSSPMCPSRGASARHAPHSRVTSRPSTREDPSRPGARWEWIEILAQHSRQMTN